MGLCSVQRNTALQSSSKDKGTWCDSWDGSVQVQQLSFCGPCASHPTQNIL